LSTVQNLHCVQYKLYTVDISLIKARWLTSDCQYKTACLVTDEETQINPKRKEIQVVKFREEILIHMVVFESE
jgi:hypothetical protein